ncbi:MAG: serine/threonine protein kinase [Planctomycetaceae bacterium]|nr:serine/threonine protein kinase [Planctomycetaceae bacterium]
MADEEFVDPLIGAKLGPCRVEERLAAGGMGVVYRARHTLLDQDVAVKILAPSLAADQEYVTRFFREAGAAGQIDHPNVIRVIDVGKFEDRYYLVMEYVAGDTLDRVIETERRLPLERATKFVREITSGLAAAHRAGIIHRDIKPGNIIVSPDGKPHLTDFGLARHAENKKGLTVEGTFLGTPEYASPEQVEGKKLDHRTDLYSLGVTYYQLLSGTLPFLGESPMEIAIKRTKEEPRPLENALTGADPRACAIVKKLLNIESGQRYQSATDLIRDLDAILQGPKPVATKGPETTRKVENVLATAKSKRRIRMLIHWDLMATAVALAFLSGGLAERGGRFLEQWTRHDAAFSTRVILLVFSAISGGLAIFMYRREFSSLPRKLVLGLLVGLMILGGLLAGAWIVRGDGATTAETLTNTTHALTSALRAPVNRLVLGLVFLFAAIQVAWEREPGSYRVMLTRILMLAGFPLVYLFGTAGLGVEAPVRQFMAFPELAIPLATATLLACFFGFMLVTGYNFESRAKGFGAALTFGGAVGLFAFAVLVSQPAREPWTMLLAEPFSGLSRSFRDSAAMLGVVLALAVVERAVVFAGMRLQDRSYRKRY